ncbi:MAG: amidohydrolase family protein [Bryobacteraceae bacterium]
MRIPALLLAASAVWAQTPSRGPEVPAMPKALIKLPRTDITRARYPAVDFHFHGRTLRTRDDYARLVRLMDDTGVGVIANMDAGFGASFDEAMRTGEPFRDRIVQFARVDFEGINEPGWSVRTAAELERCFRAGAAGLKINKALGLELKNKDGSYIQADDARFDAVWEACARHNKPVMIHTSDSYGRFRPIGPENERFEAGLWRTDNANNYYETGHPAMEVIEKARENMHAKHPKTRFVNAHVAMLYYDMDKVRALLDKYPNADVEISASVQDLGRAPRMMREFFLKYQNRILFGTDGNPRRGIDEFWVPHWRFLETLDEHFDHPAQIRSATGAPLHGRWKISGIGLPDDVLRKVYYENALRYLPASRAPMQRMVAASEAAARAAGDQVVWNFDRLDRIGGHAVTVLGDPKVVDTPIGKAVQFDGVDDALFIANHPLAGARAFTLEAIFRPDGGQHEQRWFHLSEQDPLTEIDTNNRMLFEIRVVGKQWYLDSFNQSGGSGKALMNKNALHPLGEWHHVASVYDGREFRNYVDGKLEGSAVVDLGPHGPGHTSAGVRINRVFYFQGAIHKARFTPRALGVERFLRVR